MQMSAKSECESINTQGMHCVIVGDVLYFQEGAMDSRRNQIQKTKTLFKRWKTA